jgi:hypothetical protein
MSRPKFEPGLLEYKPDHNHINEFHVGPLPPDPVSDIDVTSIIWMVFVKLRMNGKSFNVTKF